NHDIASGRLPPGKSLKFYLDALALTVYQASSGTVWPDWYLGMDGSGGVALYWFDRLTLPSPSGTYADTDGTIRGQWERIQDDLNYYGRRDAVYQFGNVTAVASGATANPYFPG